MDQSCLLNYAKDPLEIASLAAVLSTQARLGGL